MKSSLVLLVVVCAFASGFAVAKRPLIKAQVVHSKNLCSQAAPSGKAWLTRLVEGENAFVARLELAPFAKVPLHQDESEEYIHIVQGAGVMTIDSVRHELSEGSTVFMPKMAKVSFENSGQHLVALQIFSGKESAAKYKSFKACH